MTQEAEPSAGAALAAPGFVEWKVIARVLASRRTLVRHERWPRTRLDGYRRAAVGRLREFALAQSRFYRRFHAGFGSRPLEELPVLTKGELMNSFDELVTDPRLRLADVQQFLAGLTGDRRFMDRYWVARTAGSTGQPGVFIWSAQEWATVIASYERAQRWAGISAGVTKRTRLGVVSSRVPWHQSTARARSPNAHDGASLLTSGPCWSRVGGTGRPLRRPSLYQPPQLIGGRPTKALNLP